MGILLIITFMSRKQSMQVSVVIHRHPVQSSMSLPHVAAIFIVFLTLLSCSSTPRPDILHEGPEGGVYLEFLPDRKLRVAQPIKLDRGLVARILNGIQSLTMLSRNGCSPTRILHFLLRLFLRHFPEPQQINRSDFELSILSARSHIPLTETPVSARLHRKPVVCKRKRPRGHSMHMDVLYM